MFRTCFCKAFCFIRTSVCLRSKETICLPKTGPKDEIDSNNLSVLYVHFMFDVWNVCLYGETLNFVCVCLCETIRLTKWTYNALTCCFTDVGYTVATKLKITVILWVHLVYTGKMHKKSQQKITLYRIRFCVWERKGR